jgi:hypothetical protein
MHSFVKGPSPAWAPFGKNNFLRSTRDVKTESYTLAAATVPTETINGVTGQKVIQPGEILAKITSGPDVGKVGPFMALATDGRQTLANIVGICRDWLPWQTIEHDCDVAAVYEATCVQAWCFERDAAGVRIALTNTTADALRGVKGMDVHFK